MRGPKPKKRTPRKDWPLRAHVDRGVLTIEIGIDVLAFATLHGEYVSLLKGRPARDNSERYRITDAYEFARDVVRELGREAEDGSSLMTKVIDDAATAAIEDGSLAFDEINTPARAYPRDYSLGAKFIRTGPLHAMHAVHHGCAACDMMLPLVVDEAYDPEEATEAGLKLCGRKACKESFR